MRAHVTNSLPHTRTNMITNKNHKLRTHTHTRARPHAKHTLFLSETICFDAVVVVVVVFVARINTHSDIGAFAN